MGFQGAFGAVRGIPGDLVQQAGLGDHPGGAGHEQAQDGVLRPGEPHLRAVHGHPAGVRVQPQGAEGDGPALPGRGLPQAHRHPGQQLPQDEGLGNVVRRAPQEQADLAVNVRLRADHNDGEARQPGQHLLPGQAGEHEVQQGQVGPLPLHRQRRLGAGVGPAHPVALALQRLLEQVSDVDVVIDDQNVLHRIRPVSLFAVPIIRKTAGERKKKGLKFS